MKLIRCYIENFGTLHDFSYEFQAGLNTLQQENGWGKTTFGVFIKAMFYGLEYAPRKKTIDNPRKKYFPWQGGNFGGSLEFEIGDKTYRLERFFGKRDKEDTFCLYDAKTGLASEDYSEHIGEEIFHIDELSYERSTYIPQNGISIAMTDSINAKLSNLVENGNDINNYENAYAKLEERLKEYKKTGGRGRLAQLTEQIHQKQNELEECRNKADGMEKLQEQIDQQLVTRRELEWRREELKAAIRAASEKKEHAAKQEHYDSLKKRVADIQEQKEPYDIIFGADMHRQAANEDLLRQIEDDIEQLEQLEQEQQVACLNDEERQQLNTMDEFFAQGCPEMPQIEMYIGESRQAASTDAEIIRIRTRLEMLEAQRAQEKERLEAERQRELEHQQEALAAARERIELQKKIFLTAGILFLAVGLACSFLTSLGMAGGIGIAVIGIALIFVAILRKPKEDKFAKSVYDSQPYAGEKEEAYNEEYRRELAELQADLEHLTRQKEEFEEHYQMFVAQFPMQDTDGDPVQVLTEIKSKAMEYQNLSEREEERKEQRTQLTQQIVARTAAAKKLLEDIHQKYVAVETLRGGYEELIADQREAMRLFDEKKKSEEELSSFTESNAGIDFETSAQEEVSSHRLMDSQEVIQTLSLEELQNQEKQNEAEIEEINARINTYRRDQDGLSVIVDMQPDIEAEIETLSLELADAQYKCGVIEKTMQYLKAAKESFSTHYMGAMRSGFEKYAALLGGGSAGQIQLDVQLDAQVAIGASLKGSEYFSTGNRDFIGICIRLALIEALFEEEKPFIILDDPFVNLDDRKVENARMLLHEIAKEYQIIYLVCHSSRKV